MSTQSVSVQGGHVDCCHPRQSLSQLPAIRHYRKFLANHFLHKDGLK